MCHLCFFLVPFVEKKNVPNCDVHPLLLEIPTDLTYYLQVSPQFNNAAQPFTRSALLVGSGL